MASDLILRLSGLSPSPADAYAVIPNKSQQTAIHMTDLMASLKSGRPSVATMACNVAPIAASGTLTIASGSGTVGGSINGVSITVSWATSDTATATALAAAINASSNALVKNFVSASSALGVVTITMVDGGLWGNAVTLAASGTGVTASGARLTGGTDGTAQVTAAQASGTFTYSSSSGTTTATLNGVAFAQASGSDAARGAALAAAIRASANPAVQGLSAYDNGAGVVTVSGLATGQFPGSLGNAVTLAVSGTGLARSGANLSGGLDAVSTIFTY